MQTVTNHWYSSPGLNDSCYLIKRSWVIVAREAGAAGRWWARIIHIVSSCEAYHITKIHGLEYPSLYTWTPRWHEMVLKGVKSVYVNKSRLTKSSRLSIPTYIGFRDSSAPGRKRNICIWLQVDYLALRKLIETEVLCVICDIYYFSNISSTVYFTSYRN